MIRGCVLHRAFRVSVVLCRGSRELTPSVFVTKAGVCAWGVGARGVRVQGEGHQRLKPRSVRKRWRFRDFSTAWRKGKLRRCLFRSLFFLAYGCSAPGKNKNKKNNKKKKSRARRVLL